MENIFTKLTMLLIALTVSTTLWAGTYSGGGGTSGNPYQIANTDDLIELSNTSGDWGNYFTQTANISFDANEQNVDWDGDGTANWDTEDQKGFSPIGNSTTKFTGSYNGGNFDIANLYILQSTNTSNYLGLFGYADGATITYLTLSNFEVKGTYYYYDNEQWTDYGSSYIGGLVGYATNSTTISTCSGSGDVLGFKYIGGLMGYIKSSTTVTNCSSSGSVTINTSSSSGEQAGGLIGSITTTDCSVSNSSSTANVVSSSSNDVNYVGGFIGYNRGSVENCYATGNISGKGFGAGGFLGLINSSTVDVSKCYSTGNVEGRDRVGGFVGYMYGNVSIVNCYSLGDVSRISGSTSTSIAGFSGFLFPRTDNIAKIEKCYSIGSVEYTDAANPTDKGFVGGEAGEGTTTYNSNFFDSGASNQSTAGFSSATATSTANMKIATTFTNAGWDFTNTWDIDGSKNNGYPFFNGTNPVPVELVSFSASIVDETVLLNWTTATEVNNYGFEIQRSAISSQTSEKEWETIAFVAGHGNSNSTKEYSFIVADGGNQFRLKQVDVDGSVKYSEVVEVAKTIKFKLAQNYPNPFNPTTTIKYSILHTLQQNVILKVYNIIGQEVATLVNKKQTAGNYSVNFNANNLASGIYIYKIVSGNFVASKKLLLLK